MSTMAIARPRTPQGRRRGDGRRRRRPRRAARPRSTPADVGDHLGHDAEGERVVTHLFACTPRRVPSAGAGRSPWPGPPGRRPSPSTRSCWSRAPRRSWRPTWVPYRERIKPGDLSPGDLLPVGRRRPAAGADVLLRRRPARRRRQGPGPRGGHGARPRPRPHALARGPRAGRPAVVRRRRRPRGRRSRSRRPSRARRCGFLIRVCRARSPRRSGSAPTATPTTTAGSCRFDHGCGAHSEVAAGASGTSRCRCPTRSSTRSTTSSTSSDGVSRPGQVSQPTQPTRLSRAERRGALAAAAVLQPEQPEPEAGQRRSTAIQPCPASLRVGRRTGSRARNADQPERDADLDRADAVDVEGLDVGDEVGAVADLADRRLVVAQLHGTTLVRRTGVLSATLPVRADVWHAAARDGSARGREHDQASRPTDQARSHDLGASPRHQSGLDRLLQDHRARLDASAARSAAASSRSSRWPTSSC